MTPEQKAALERWRDKDSYWSSDIDDNRQWFDEVQYNQDREVLMDLVLAEHPADGHSDEGGNLNAEPSTLIEHGRAMWWLGAVSGLMVGTTLTGIAYAILEGFR